MSTSRPSLLHRLRRRFLLEPAGYGRPVDQAAVDGEYRSGAWAHFHQLPELPRQSVVVGYVSQLHANPAILDLGCGSGWFASALDRCGFRVTGGDRDETALQRARRHRPEMDFVHLDVELPPHPALLRRFDAVVAIDLLDHLPRPGAAIATALAALKPGGLFIASVPHHGYAKNLVLAVGGRLDARWEAAVDGGRLKHFSRETLHALLRDRGLQTVQVQPIGRVPMFARAMLAAGRAPG